ncbi:MAG: YceD family protein [Solirubrobacterales bacterium]
MPPVSNTVDLGELGLKPGGGIRFDAAVPVGDFVFGEQRYKLAEDPALVMVDVSRTTSGYVIRLRGEHDLEGPCMRCYGDYSLAVKIDHSEVHEPHLDRELASEYVDAKNELDLAGLTRDAIGLMLPTSISSPVDENGLCTECENSKQQLSHLSAGEEEPQLDPRWAKLRELEL